MGMLLKGLKQINHAKKAIKKPTKANASMSLALQVKMLTTSVIIFDDCFTVSQMKSAVKSRAGCKVTGF